MQPVSGCPLAARRTSPTASWPVCQAAPWGKIFLIRIRPGQEQATKAASSVDGDENPAVPIVEEATPPVTLRPRPWTVFRTVTFLRFSMKNTRHFWWEKWIMQTIAHALVPFRVFVCFFLCVSSYLPFFVFFLSSELHVTTGNPPQTRHYFHRKNHKDTKTTTN